LQSCGLAVLQSCGLLQSSVILSLAPCALLPASCVQRPASSVLRPASCVQRPASCVQRPASCVQRPASCVLRPASCVLRLSSSVQRPLQFHIQFFLKNQANIYAEPNIAIIVTKPANERTAIPERAAPLVQPLANWAP